MASATPRNTTMNTAIKLDMPGSDEEYYLTALSSQDAEALHEIVTLEPVNKFLPHIPKSWPLEMARSHVATQIAIHTILLSYPTRSQRTRYFFSDEHTIPPQAIRHSHPEGPFIGAVILTSQPNTHTVNLEYYYLHPSHQGKNVMQAAAKAALSCAKEFGVTDVHGNVDYGNVKGGKLMERIARETCGSSEKEISRGDGVLVWPGEKTEGAQGEKVERGCWTWLWKV